MRKVILNFILFLNFIRCLPHLIIFYFHPEREIIKSDILVWLRLKDKHYSITLGMIYLLSFYREYRNLFYYRVGWIKYFLNIFCPKSHFLIINSKSIGEGFYIDHGYSTIIGAEFIGKNCRVSQQVTIGENLDKRPIIQDNVRILSGAIIVGGITIGSNSIIGANTTILRDIPGNSTVYPSLPIIMKWDKD